MTIQLPPLPYAGDALAPYISERTLDLHHGKHHASYVANLNRLLSGSERGGETLDQIVATAEAGPLLNNAAQAWNHTFYWESMSPEGGGDPDGQLATAIAASFGSVDLFRKEFIASATTKFGSGWTWLVVNENHTLAIVNTDDADNPLRHRQVPLLTIDVWEHAYYLDYQNARASYVENWVEHLMNWDFAAANHRGAATGPR